MIQESINNMSKMKSMLGMAMMMASLGSMSSHSSKVYSEPKESDKERDKRLADAELKRKKRQGLKEFTYNGGTVWAINKTVADKKAKNNGYF